MKPAVLRTLLLMLPVGYGLTLTWQEWQFRQSRSTPVPAEVAPRAPAPMPPAVLNITAIATVFGLAAHTSRVNSNEALTLRAIVLVDPGDSRALLAGPDGARFYRAGERLPGGSLLRRIEAAQVVLWRQGREELLGLHPAGGRFLRTAQAQGQAAAVNHLRPMVDQPGSD